MWYLHPQCHQPIVTDCGLNGKSGQAKQTTHMANNFVHRQFYNDALRHHKKFNSFFSIQDPEKVVT